MRKTDTGLELSASDLVGHLCCRHLTDLDVKVALGSIQRLYYYDPLLEILSRRGQLHERQYLEHLRQSGYDVIEIEGAGVFGSQVDETMKAMREGRAIIAQATLRSGVWVGRIDVLRKVRTPSTLGDWSYEVIDAKLARETKGGTILQLALYSELVAEAQGLDPEAM